MPVPFGFGIGDFIAGVGLIVTTGNALRESVGSAELFRTLISELRSFGTTLIYVRRFAECAKQNNDERNQGLAELIRVSRGAIDDILEKLDEYQRHLGPASKLYKSRVKDPLYKIKFRFAQGRRYRKMGTAHRHTWDFDPRAPNIVRD
jgi:hypothetical protein